MSTNCGKPPKIAHGFVRNKKSYAEYSCNSGYALYGTDTIYCNNGYWDTDSFPTCLYIRPRYDETFISISSQTNSTVLAAVKFNPVWYWYGIMGAAGLLFLCVVVCCLLSCCHICGCCPGPVVGFGGRYQLSDRRWYSLLSWCDFMTKGKVCRKIRRKTETKVGIPHDDKPKGNEKLVKMKIHPQSKKQPETKQASTVDILDETKKPKSKKGINIFNTQSEVKPAEELANNKLVTGNTEESKDATDTSKDAPASEYKTPAQNDSLIIEEEKEKMKSRNTTKGSAENAPDEIENTKNKTETENSKPKIESKSGKNTNKVTVIELSTETTEQTKTATNSSGPVENKTSTPPKVNSSAAHSASSSSTSSSPEPGDDPTMPLVPKVVVTKKTVKSKKIKTLHQPSKDKTNAESSNTEGTAGVTQPLVGENVKAKSTTKKKLTKRK